MTKCPPGECRRHGKRPETFECAYWAEGYAYDEPAAASETPRTNTAEEGVLRQYAFKYQKDHGLMRAMDEAQTAWHLSRQLERELTAANKQIADQRQAPSASD